MGIFDDGIDAEEMGLIGALSEELSEERREQRRLRRELEAEDDEEADEEGEDPLPQRGRRARAAPGRRRPPGPTGATGELFLRYMRDVNRGLKGRHDSLYGPPRSPEDGRPLATAIDFFGVRVENAHLVSDRFLHLIYVCMVRVRDHGLAAVVFTDDGTPVVNGVEELGTFDVSTRTITINLRLHFEMAVRTAAHGYSGCKLTALIWKGMATTLLHELAHAVDTARDPSRRRGRASREGFADAWTAELMTALALAGQLEPPAEETEEPYFGVLATEALAAATAAGEPWAAEQRTLSASRLVFRDAATGISLATEKEFYALSLAGAKGDPRGRRLNDFIRRGRAREQAAQEREEELERRLREALHARREVVVDYRFPGGQPRRLRGIPAAIRKKGPFLAVSLAECEAGAPVELRLDHLEAVAEPDDA
jgi:hypothetical protein